MSKYIVFDDAGSYSLCDEWYRQPSAYTNVNEANIYEI